MNLIPLPTHPTSRPTRQNLLEWDESIRLFVGEWHPGSGRLWRITVTPRTMRSHLTAWQRSGITREQALSVSVWIESHTLCRQMGESLPGVNVVEVI